MTLTPRQFQQTLLAWFDQFGRHDLPWQHNKTPYRVWVSEIMLQQTQVSTVIPYYENFMQRFPTIEALANASEETVLHAWAGLGYYSRARNLHAAAKQIMTTHQGQFPVTAADLQSLPGIGQSTAGAIAAIAFGQRATILDGNVKRVLARLHAIPTSIKATDTINQLWDIATCYTPKQRSADYTQAIMDFGATLCTRNKPQCTRCPLSAKCLAYQQGLEQQIPVKAPTKTIPTRKATFLLLQHGKQILLIKRPAKGIWGGLWCLPSLDDHLTLTAVKKLLGQPVKATRLETLKHTFSHYHLLMQPILIQLTSRQALPALVKNQESQHGMLWVGNPFLPEQHQGVPYDDAVNRLGSWSGLMAQAGHGDPADSFVAGDLKNASLFGQNFAETLGRICEVTS